MNPTVTFNFPIRFAVFKNEKLEMDRRPERQRERERNKTTHVHMNAYLYIEYHWKVYMKPVTAVASEGGIRQLGVRDRGKLAFHSLPFKIFWLSCTCLK